MADGASGPGTRPSLLLRLRDAGDTVSWQTFVDVYGPLVHGYCRSRGLQEADAAEVMQEVLLRVHQAIARFEYRPEQGRFRDWLGTVTRNRLASFFKKAGGFRARGQVEGPDELASVVAAEQDTEWTEACMRRIYEAALLRVRPHFEEHTWRAFELAEVENRPVEEVAQALGREPGWVYMAKSRVLKRLQEEVRELSDDTAL